MAEKILICGDVCLHHRTESFLVNDVVSSLSGITHLVERVDYAILNLECAITDGVCTPIEKSGPNLQCAESLVAGIVKSGFQGVTLANNHFSDYGQEGVEFTMKVLQRYKLDTVGGGRTIEDASKVLYKDFSHHRVAIINCCEHEFTIANENVGGANPLDIIDITCKIQEAKAEADYIVMIIHGGHEHYSLPDCRMKKIYRYFVDQGVDAVINHHQHCFSGYEVYKGKPIFYGLGNFFFDWNGQRGGSWNEGYVVELILEDSVSFKLHPYIQCDEEPMVRLMTLSEEENFYRRIEELNSMISSEEILKVELSRWVEKKQSEYVSLLLPKYGKWIKRLLRWHILNQSKLEQWCPRYLTKDRRMALKSIIQCESHRELILKILSNEESETLY